MNRIFVDVNRNLYTGIEADEKYKQKNDLCFLENDGVIRVTQDRWLEAQSYEKKTWMVDGRSMSDDRNYEHHQRFEQYIDLLKFSQEIHSILEIGCGPFTNIRTLIDKLPNLNKIILTDPLLYDYLDHPQCYYKNKIVNGLSCELYSIPFENFEINEQYDLIIMNNVLEHCFNIPKIFENILKTLKKGGLLIFSDVFYNPETLKVHISFYDAGHPLRLPKKIMEDFLENFDVVFNREFTGLYGQSWRNDKYFIGQKK